MSRTLILPPWKVFRSWLHNPVPDNHQGATQKIGFGNLKCPEPWCFPLGKSSGLGCITQSPIIIKGQLKKSGSATLNVQNLDTSPFGKSSGPGCITQSTRFPISNGFGNLSCPNPSCFPLREVLWNWLQNPIDNKWMDNGDGETEYEFIRIKPRGSVIYSALVVYLVSLLVTCSNKSPTKSSLFSLFFLFWLGSITVDCLQLKNDNNQFKKK